MDFSAIPKEVWQNGIVAALLFVIAASLFLMYRQAQNRLIARQDAEIATLRKAVDNYQRQIGRMADGQEIIVRFIEKLPNRPAESEPLPHKSDYYRQEPQEETGSRAEKRSLYS